MDELSRPLNPAARAGALLRNVALYAAGLTFVLSWLSLVQGAFGGEAYKWCVTLFDRTVSGAGLGGDFWFLVAQTTIAGVVLYLGLRRPGAVAYGALIGWLAFNAALYAHCALIEPESTMMRIGSVAIEGVIEAGLLVIYIAAFAAAVAGAMLELWSRREFPRFSWTEANTIAVLAVLGILPLQVALFRYGPPGHDLDGVGMMLTAAQWGFLVFALGLNRRAG